VRFLLPHCGAEELYRDCEREGPLFVAAAAGRTGVVATLCKYIADHKIVGALDFRGPGRMTPLMAAVAEQHVDVIACLVHYGCDLEAYNSNCDTVLVQAVKRGDIEMVSFLCVLGVNVNNTTPKPTSALKEAILRDEVEIATVLCNHGADTGYRMLCGLTLVEFAEDIDPGWQQSARPPRMISMLQEYSVM